MVSLLSFFLPKFLEVRDDTKKVHCPLDRKVNWMSNPLWIIEALYARGEYTCMLASCRFDPSFQFEHHGRIGILAHDEYWNVRKSGRIEARVHKVKIKSGKSWI